MSASPRSSSTPSPAAERATLTADAPGSGDAPRRGRRPTNRRELILAAAIELFHQRGYHATGVDDIGEAVDVSGPAIYRHFSSKEDILLEAIERAADRVHAANTAAREADDDPAAVVEGFIRAYARVAIEESALIAVWSSEARHLTPERRAPMIRRLRAWRAEWIEVLRALRPDLDDDLAAVLVAGAVGLITAVATSDIDDDPVRLEDRVVVMARSVLATPTAELCPGGGP